MILPVLSEEEIIDLTKHGYDKVVVHYRPMDLLDKSRWADKCNQAKVKTSSAEGRALGMRDQLISIDNLQFQDKDKNLFPYSDKFFPALPLGFLPLVWDEIERNSSLSEVDEKNSERPSESIALSGTAASPVEPVQSETEIPSAAS